jgi:hypothetical protein
MNLVVMEVLTKTFPMDVRHMMEPCSHRKHIIFTECKMAVSYPSWVKRFCISKKDRSL